MHVLRIPDFAYPPAIAFRKFPIGESTLSHELGELLLGCLGSGLTDLRSTHISQANGDRAASSFHGERITIDNSHDVYLI